MMSSVRMIDDQKVLYVKGAPSAILDHCTQIFDGNKVRPITATDKKNIKDYVEKEASLAMRNLAMAYRPIPDYATGTTWQDAEKNLIFL